MLTKKQKVVKVARRPRQVHAIKDPPNTSTFTSGSKRLETKSNATTSAY